MTLGQRIQELRKKQGLSQEALGEKLGVSLNDLLQVERSEEKQEEPVGNPDKDRKLIRRWLGALTALCILLAGGLGVLWGQYRELARTLPVEEECVSTKKPLFQTVDCDLSPITLGFPQARGEEDLTITLTLEPVKALKGWEVLGLEVLVIGYDPWGDTPKADRNWEETLEVPAEKVMFGPWKAQFTLGDYGGESLSITAVLREKATGRTMEACSLLNIRGVAERSNDFAVESIEVIRSDDSYTINVPKSLALQLPDPRFE